MNLMVPTRLNFRNSLRCYHILSTHIRLPQSKQCTKQIPQSVYSSGVTWLTQQHARSLLCLTLFAQSLKKFSLRSIYLSVRPLYSNSPDQKISHKPEHILYEVWRRVNQLRNTRIQDSRPHGQKDGTCEHRHILLRLNHMSFCTK